MDPARAHHLAIAYFIVRPRKMPPIPHLTRSASLSFHIQAGVKSRKPKHRSR